MGTLYERRVLNNPEVHLSIGDPLIPIVAADQTTLELDNSDGYFDALDLRGERLSYARFDAISNEVFAEMTGLVTEQTLLVDRVRLVTTAQDVTDLQTLLPKRTVTTALFPLAHPQQGLGKPIPIAFGIADSTNKVNDSWELPYVGENISSNYYDYLIGEGTFANVTVYRSTVGNTLLAASLADYTVNTTAYPGVTVIRFVLRQVDAGGSYYRIFAAADSVENGRNGARAVQGLLSNATWGLGLTVATASFDTAAAAWDAVGGLYVDGAITEQKPALDWLNQLLMMRGLTLGRDSIGERTLSVMASRGKIRGKFGHGRTVRTPLPQVGQAEVGAADVGDYGGGQVFGNVTTFNGLSKLPVDQAVKSLILEYRKDRWSGQYILATTARQPVAVGRELRIQNDFIRDRTTADRVADFVSKREQYRDNQLALKAGQEARRILPGDLITYDSIRPEFNDTFLVTSVRRPLDSSDMMAEGWADAIFSYTPAALPAEPPLT